MCVSPGSNHPTNHPSVISRNYLTELVDHIQIHIYIYVLYICIYVIHKHHPGLRALPGPGFLHAAVPLHRPTRAQGGPARARPTRARPTRAQGGPQGPRRAHKGPAINGRGALVGPLGPLWAPSWALVGSPWAFVGAPWALMDQALMGHALVGLIPIYIYIYIYIYVCIMYYV